MATTNTSAVTQLYQEIEYRAPDAADLATYSALLNAGSLTLAQVTSDLEADPYTQNYVNPVIREYQAAFGRVPDQAGVAYWSGVVAANPAALATLSTTFANSAEFSTLYGGVTATTIGSTALVTALYENVLGRTPDAAGLAYWIGKDFTAAQLLQAFAQSAEFITDTAPAIINYQNAEAAGDPPLVGSLLDLAPGSGTTFTLTTGTDTVTAPTTNNNVVNATELTLNAFDSINLGTTTGNVLNWIDNTDVAVPLVVVDYHGSVAVSGVQTANFDAITAVSVDTTGWTGLNTVNVTSFDTSTVGDTVTADTTTVVNVTDTLEHNVTTGLIVNGGSVDTITEHNGAFVGSVITVDGGVGTTAVTVNQTFTTGADQNVTILDGATGLTSVGTITSVTLNGLSGNVVDFTGEALTNLSVSNVTGGADVFLNDGTGPATGGATTLNLALSNDGFLFVEDDADKYTTLNVTANASTNAVTGLANPIRLEVDSSSITAETVNGTGVLFQESFDLNGLATIAISGAAGFTDWDLGVTNVTSVTSTSTGTVTVALDAQQTTFTGGAGTDFVAINEDATVAIAAGSASNNEIVLNESGATFTAAGTYAHVTGFEILGTYVDSSGAYNLTGFSAPISNVDVRSEALGALTFNNSAAVQTLSVDAGQGADGGITLVQAASVTGVHNILNLNLGTALTSGIDTSNIAAGATMPVGTVATVAEHAGLTTSSVTDTAFVAPTAWVDTVTITGAGAGVGFSYELDGVTVGGAWAVSGTNQPQDAAQLAALINANATLSSEVTATVNVADQVVVTGKVPGVIVHTVVDNPDGGTAIGDVATAGTAGTKGFGTLTVTGTDPVANQLTVSDDAGTVIGVLSLTPGETEDNVATAVGALLTADLFTGVTVAGNQVSYTYPTVGDHGLTTTDAVSQLDTIALGTVTSIVAGDKFTETVTSTAGTATVTYTAVGGDTATSVATGLAALINAQSGTTDVVATTTGSNVYLTSTVDTQTFTDSGVSETTFGAVGSQAITANGYQTVNLDSLGTNLGLANTTYLVDNALTNLVITGSNDLTLATSGGTHLASIDTTGVTADVVVDLTGVLPSEVTTGLTATLGAADVIISGNAGVLGSTLYTDTFTGSGSADITGTLNGGNTHVTYTDGPLNTVSVTLTTGLANVVSLGNGGSDTVTDTAVGTSTAHVSDTITLGNGASDLVTVSGNAFSAFTVTLGNGASDVVHTGVGAATVTLGNGSSDLLTTGSGAVTAHLGNGASDTVDLGSGAATVTLGTGLGDTVNFTTGVDTVTFGAHTPGLGLVDTVNFVGHTGSSFATPTTTSQVNVLTGSLDVVTGLVAGDHVILPVSDTVVVGGANGAGVDNDAIFANGTYSASAGTFTFGGASAHDTLLTYDDGSNHFVSVVLVGYTAGAHTAISGDTVTLA